MANEMMPGSESWPRVEGVHYPPMFYTLLQQFIVSYTTDTPMDYYDESEESYSALSNPVEETAAGDTGVTEATVAPRELNISVNPPIGKSLMMIACIKFSIQKHCKLSESDK